MLSGLGLFLLKTPEENMDRAVRVCLGCPKEENAPSTRSTRAGGKWESRELECKRSRKRQVGRLAEEKGTFGDNA